MCSILWADKDVVSLIRSQSKKSWFGILQNLLSLCILLQRNNRCLLFSDSIELCSSTVYVVCTAFTVTAHSIYLSIHCKHIHAHTHTLYRCCLSPVQRGHSGTALLWQLRYWHQIVAIVPVSPLDPTYYCVDTDFHPLSVTENRSYYNCFYGRPRGFQMFTAVGQSAFTASQRGLLSQWPR